MECGSGYVRGPDCDVVAFGHVKLGEVEVDLAHGRRRADPPLAVQVVRVRVPGRAVGEVLAVVREIGPPRAPRWKLLR